MYYTKYRPQKFSEIAKPNEVAEALLKQLSTGKTVHAYLFVGPRGTGKTSTARILAKALNCEHLDKTGDPCGECDSCLAIKEGNYLDLHEIDAASNRGIDDIRELREKIKLAPSLGKVKIYIIDEVHMLTTEAFNALLKTLEEPPKNTVFILCTTELHKVPETIKSRCQLFKFKRASSAQLTEKLASIAKSEKSKISKEDIEKIARASVGGFRDAETLLQQVIEGEVNLDNLINISSKHSIEELIIKIWEKDSKAALSIINSTYDDGIDLFVWAGETLRYLRALLLLKSGFGKDSLDYPAEMFENEKFVNAVTVSWLIEAIEQISKAHTQIKLAYLPQLPLEVAALNICGFLGSPGINSANASSHKPAAPENGGGEVTKAFKAGNVKPAPETKEPKSKKAPEASAPPEASVDVVVSTTVIEDTSVDGIQPAEEPISQAEESLFTLEQITEKWTDILAKVKELNSSVQALLKSGKPCGINGKFVIVEVYFSFHKERLESHKNRAIVEQALLELFEMPLSIKCELSSNKPKHLSDREVGVLTDHNVVVPGGEKFDRDNVLSMLDGGLPL